MLMGAKSKIEWTDKTYNYWEGCTPVSRACDGCYAQARNARFAGGVAINWGSGAPRRLTSLKNRNNLERWNKLAFFECTTCGHRGSGRRGAPGICEVCGGSSLNSTRQRVFCSSLSDVFDNEVDPEWRKDLFAKMVACTSLDMLVLTKRIGNVRKMVPAEWLEPGGWPAHVRIGATIANQEEAERDLPKLLDLPCPNFVSIEPQLGLIDLVHVRQKNGQTFNALSKKEGIGLRGKGVEWVICGGESGPGARPLHPTWAGQLRDQCRDAGVPYMFKQYGEWLPISQMKNEDHQRLFRSKVKAKEGQDQAVLDDCYGRECRVPTGVVQMDGTLAKIELGSFIDGAMQTFKVGKEAAGRQLDGRTWDGVPS